MHQPHLHQPWRLDRCNAFIHFFCSPGCTTHHHDTYSHAAARQHPIFADEPPIFARATSQRHLPLRASGLPSGCKPPCHPSPAEPSPAEMSHPAVNQTACYDGHMIGAVASVPGQQPWTKCCCAPVPAGRVPWCCWVAGSAQPCTASAHPLHVPWPLPSALHKHMAAA